MYFYYGNANDHFWNEVICIFKTKDTKTVENLYKPPRGEFY